MAGYISCGVNTQNSLQVHGLWSDEKTIGGYQHSIFQNGSWRTASKHMFSGGATTYVNIYYDWGGLSPGTSYPVRIQWFTADGNTSRGFSEGTCSTASPPQPQPPGNMGSITLSNVTGTTFQLSWNAVTRATSYIVEVRVGSSTGSLVNIWYPTGLSQLVHGLNPSTLYWIRVTPVNSDGQGSSTTRNATTLSPPAMPTNFRVYNRPDNTSLSLTWNTVSDATNYVIETYRASSGALVWSNYNITGSTVTVTGLIFGVTYNMKLYATGAGGNSEPTWLYGVIAGARPNNWEWDIVKAKGRSYNMSNGRFTNLLSHKEMTDFRSRINEFRLYKGLSAYTWGSMTQGSVFTATHYNQMETAISAMNPPTATYGQRSAGSSYTVDVLLNRLRDSLNSIT